MDAGAVAPGTEGKQARCRGCGAPFRVIRDGPTLRAEAEAPPPAPAETPPPGEKPTRRKRPTTGTRRSAKTRKPPTGAGRERPAGGPPPAPAAAVTPFGIGDRLGRYEIEDVIARGGMGGIYKAYDPSANRHVALKVLVSTATELDKLRFQREIQVQGNIQHPQIMPIFDSGVFGATRFYTMELLKDPLDVVELAELVHTGQAAKDPKLRPLATIEGLVERLVLPICRAIHHANVNEGVLHRDLKPGNILVDRNGLRVFVIDFGVSSLLEKKNARLAHLDTELPVPLRGEGISITGTLLFMPPEQARGRADRRGDVWALGALLHYLVTNEAPLQNAIRPVVSREQRIEGLKLLIEQARGEGHFSEATDYEDRLRAIVNGTERTIDDLREDVLRGRYLPRPAGLPRALDAIIEKAMRPDPEQRYRHAAELAEDLEAWLAGRAVRAHLHSAGAAGGLVYAARLFLRRHRAWVAVLAVLLAAALVTIRAWPDGARVDAAALAQRHMDAALVAEREGKPGAARAEAREALRHEPDRHEAFALMARLEAAERLERAVRRARTLATGAREAFAQDDAPTGRRALAALEEVLTTSVLPALDTPGGQGLQTEMDRLLAFSRDEQPLRVEGAPGGCTFSLFPVQPGPGPVRWDRELELPAAAVGLDGATTVRSGSWILRIRRGRGEVFVPFVVAEGGSGQVVTCPVDPTRVDPSSAYVAAGASLGPGRPTPVQALLWDRDEVTASEYAAFLATLPPAEQRARVPRLAGDLGEMGEPIWDSGGDGFRPPANTLRRAVEGISLHDARAYAAFVGKRLPTAAEWSWAATGPDRRVCPVGGLGDLIGTTVHVDRPLAGVADARSSVLDRSPFGLYDLAGNVAEFTSTLGTLRGDSGWFVMGGSYLEAPARAVATDARIVPGWQPLQGVGLRCVREIP